MNPIRMLPVCLALAALVLPLPAEDGIGDAEIVIGQVAALNGPVAELGTGINAGLAAAIAEANAKGGIHGRRLRLIAADDGYDPGRALDAALRLVEEDRVFCLAGLVGSATAKNAEPALSESRIPVVGLMTGASFLRQPVKRYIYNVRASYADEAEAQVEHLVKDLGAKRIAILYQNDAFGRAGLTGTEAALKRRGMALAGQASFERGSLELQAQVNALAATRPDALIMTGPAKPVAAIVRLARAAKLDAALATCSFVATETLIRELGAAEAEGLVISQVVPSPADPAVPLVRDYLNALRSSAPDRAADYTSLEGYAYGRVLVLGLERAGRDLTREKLVDALDGITATSLGGMPIAFARDNHQASSQVFLTQVRAGRAVQVTTLARAGGRAPAAPAVRAGELP